MSEPQLDAPPIEDRLAAARAGDLMAINELLGRFRPWMIRIAKGHGPKGESSDVVQNALLKVAKNLHEVRAMTTAQFSAWLRTIVLHECYDELNKQRKEREHRESFPNGSSGQFDPQGPDPTPSAKAIENEEEERLRQALARMSDRDQFVIQLRDFWAASAEERLTFEEIAEVLGTSPNNACKLHGRAMQRLGELLNGPPRQEPSVEQ